MWVHLTSLRADLCPELLLLPAPLVPYPSPYRLQGTVTASFFHHCTWYDFYSDTQQAVVQ